MQNIPTDLLRTFVTVAQLGGFTQAGELLGRSQPAVSLQIKRLEQLLDQALFIRSGQHLELSQAGQKLLGYAKQILALNDQAIDLFNNSNISGKIRFGIPSEFATTLLPKIIGHFAQAYPSITLEINCDLSKNLLTPGQRKHYDVILALHDNPREAGSQQIKTDELVWVTSHQHKAHLRDTVPLVVAPEGCIYRKRATESLDNCHQPWHIVYTIPDLTGIQAAIEEGLGVTVLAKSTVPSNLKIMRPSEKFPPLGNLGIRLIVPKNNRNAAVSLLADYVKTSLGK